MHPDRRREGRRIRKARKVDVPQMLVIVDEVQAIDWKQVVDTLTGFWARLETEITRAFEQMATWFSEEFFATVCPDCKAGKHDACIGRAWNDAKDEEVDCSCALAEHAVEVAEVAERIEAARSIDTSKSPGRG